MAKSGRADILELLFWIGIFEILAETLPWRCEHQGPGKKVFTLDGSSHFRGLFIL